MEYRTQPSSKPQRVPRRIIHCSDGIIEEYSTDSESDEDDKTRNTKQQTSAANAAAVQEWGPWIAQNATRGVKASFTMAEYAGGKLADFFGITTPMYQYEIDEYNRVTEEIKEKQANSLVLGERLPHQRAPPSAPFVISRNVPFDISLSSVTVSSIPHQTVTISTVPLDTAGPIVRVTSSPSGESHNTTTNAVKT